jgi:multidrug resistance efflux pump
MFKYLFFSAFLVATAASVIIIDSKAARYSPASSRAEDVTTIHATGIVEGANRDVQLRPEIAGRVVEISAVIGRSVNAGDVLLRLDDRHQRHLVEVSRARLELARAQLQRLINGARPSERQEAKALWDAKASQLTQAKRTWDRIRELQHQAAVTQQQADEQHAIVSTLTAEFDAARARWEQLDAPARDDEVREANARIAAAEAELSLAQVALEKCELRAPCSGCVLDIDIEPGELVGPDVSVPAIVLADTAILRVRAFVEEIDAPRLTQGLGAKVTADGLPDQSFKGQIESLSPRMSAKQIFSGAADELYDTKVREVIVALNNMENLVVGLRVDVTFDDVAGPQHVQQARLNSGVPVISSVGAPR